MTRAVPVLVEIPHAGCEIPTELRARLAPFEHDLRRDADLYVDELFDRVPERGATLLTARLSRYVVDLNRSETDTDARTTDATPVSHAPAPRGVVWRETADGRPLFQSPLTRNDFGQRLDRFYRPYHQALTAAVTALREQHGHAIIVSAHSMPSSDGAARADIVPGTRSRTTAHEDVIDAVETHFRSAGLSVRHDNPYRGGATTARWGQPARGFHAIQIEVNRRLYMDEVTLARRSDTMVWLAALCAQLVDRLGSIVLR